MSRLDTMTLITDLVNNVSTAGETSREVRQIVATTDRVIRLPVSHACALTTTLCMHCEAVIKTHYTNVASVSERKIAPLLFLPLT